jgi:hypothetical protein
MVNYTRHRDQVEVIPIGRKVIATADVQVAEAVGRSSWRYLSHDTSISLYDKAPPARLAAA